MPFGRFQQAAGYKAVYPAPIPPQEQQEEVRYEVIELFERVLNIWNANCDSISDFVQR